MRFSTLEHLWHDLSDGSSRFLLHSAGRVRVDVQREARAAVAEHRGDRFHVHAALQRGRGETMSQVMKSDVLQANVLADLAVDLHDGVRVIHFTGYALLRSDYAGGSSLHLLLIAKKRGRFPYWRSVRA